MTTNHAATPGDANKPRSSGPDFALAIPAAFVLFLAVWFRIYFSSNPIAAVDLPGHLTAMEGLRRNLLTLTYSFYDVSCFTGYAAFQFYGFTAHMFAAIVSLPLTPFADDPMRVAAHITLIFAQATLPFSMLWALHPMAVEVLDGDEALARRWRWVLAGTVTVFSFWFINHDYQWYGIGAAAVMNIGLFSQAFGWHFMILHFGSLCRLIKSPDDSETRRLALMFAMLFLTHSMTAIFSFYLAVMSWFWFREHRWRIALAHIMGILIMGFWFIPMTSTLSSYTGLDIHRPQGDIFEIMFRYPIFGVLRSIRSWLGGQFTPLNATEPFLFVLVILGGMMRQTQRSKLFMAFLIFEILGMLVLTNGWVATSVPMGFHYYRFVAYLLLFVLLPLAVVPLAILRTVDKWNLGPKGMLGAQLAMAGVLALCFGSTIGTPHNERERVLKTEDPVYLSNEYKVLEHFKNQPAKGRVLFEYFSNYDKFPFLSCHFMTSRLLKDTGFESVNGLFVQSSLAYHFPMGAANQLKANSYNGPLLFPAVADVNDDLRVRQMLEFGITHVVLFQDDFYNRIKKFQKEEPITIGQYRIVKLQDPQPMVQTAKKRVAVFTDLSGNVPFKFMELYFFAKQKLSDNYELIGVKPGEPLPAETELVIVHGRPGAAADVADEMKQAVIKAGGSEPRVLAFKYRQEYLVRHYNTWYQFNPEIDDFSDFGKWMDKFQPMQEIISSATPVSPQDAASVLHWANDYQSFDVDGLSAKRLYRINYSHFPYWHTWDGQTYRGSGDRIFFIPDSDKAHFSYTRWYTAHTYVGWALTLLGMAWVWLGRKKKTPAA